MARVLILLRLLPVALELTSTAASSIEIPVTKEFFAP